MIARRVPAQRYAFPEDDVAVVLDQIGSLLRARAFLTDGQHVKEFERQFAAYAQVAHAIAVSSGTAALQIILHGLNVAGKEVIVPTNTFGATAFAVLHAGGSPVFADCGPDLQVDVDDVEARIGERTAAVITVHIGGFVNPRLPELRALCDRHGVALVEDAAHAHGSTLFNHQAGYFGRAAAYSFFSTKVMTTGEGGMIVTNDARLADLAVELRDQGKVGGANLHRHVGSNWRMPEITAILGVTQLRRLNQFIAERARVARIYDQMLSDVAGVAPLQPGDGCMPNWYKYVLVGPGLDELPSVRQRLRAEHGVELGGFVYETPCHKQPVFARPSAPALPHAEWLCRHHLCPPIYPELSDEDARHVAQSLRAVLR
jgi:perosamine synthetase